MYSINDVLKILEKGKVKYKYNYLAEISINAFSSLNDLKENSITWVKHINEHSVAYLKNTSNVLFLCDIDEYREDLDNVIFVANLKRTFFRIIKEFFGEMDYDQQIPKVEKSAIVLSEKIGNSVYIGHHSFIDRNVSIGNNVTILHNVVIQGNVSIADDVFIESGANIGVCGFGYYLNEQNKSERVPHLGRIIIGNKVVIGAGTCIARGSLNDTIIEDNVKIDNLCHIAHSVHLRDGAMITACSEISGSVTIGENTWLGPNTSIKNGLTLGNNVFTGIATNVVKDVPDDTLIYGNPGKIKGEK
ncbi:hypothetical protein GSF08_02265 [Clostridiaceae bacterium DONG20-135]|uniref:UDP-3-O-(3-hydroxymyristoyl)glucosamine N-acyltransferase n=1 Tax=Copranaerobaculum intestinale TaxID=2692629 RepID=A0A6N8U4G0_9FIRM|nr:UDP-3-O-(3-hydroxymyristoyl)glucosamine N-acyltransferase [Copranaerobaculum intestinale]MXQ72771.1 hypothetical protein [Copranaerobaculum intestinale]